MEFILTSQLWDRTVYFVAACLIINIMLPIIVEAATLNQAGVRLGRLGTQAGAFNGTTFATFVSRNGYNETLTIVAAGNY